jgi:transposase
MEIKTIAGVDANFLREPATSSWKTPSNLTHEQHARPTDLLEGNLRIVKAYLLKELFRKLWEYTRRDWPAAYLKRWFSSATHSRIKPPRNFPWILRRREEAILAYFARRIDNPPLEAMNNNANAITHTARRYSSETTSSPAIIYGLAKLDPPKCRPHSNESPIKRHLLHYQQ